MAYLRNFAGLIDLILFVSGQEYFTPIGTSPLPMKGCKILDRFLATS